MPFPGVFGRAWSRTALALTLLLAVAACSGEGARRLGDRGAVVAINGPGGRAISWRQIRGTPGLENLREIAPGVFTGGLPEGEAGFDSLAALGVRTVVSVDGAVPEVGAARARGMRYVHVPTGYDGLRDDQRLAVARAIRDLPGPVYVHCHHGLHRAPTAASSALVGLGRLEPAVGEAFLREAGTSDRYPGLYACVRNGGVIDLVSLGAEEGELPEVVRPEGLVASMVEIDRLWARLKKSAGAGWVTPEDHPDLAPAADAGALAEVYRMLVEAPADPPNGHARTATYDRLMADSYLAAAALERLLAGASARPSERRRAEADGLRHRLKSGCIECHAGWRN